MGKLYLNARIINLAFNQYPFQADDEGGSDETVWGGFARKEFNEKFLPIKNDMLKIVRAMKNLELAKEKYDEYIKLYNIYVQKKELFNVADGNYNMYGWGKEEVFTKEQVKSFRDNALREMNDAKRQAELVKAAVLGHLNQVGQ